MSKKIGAWSEMLKMAVDVRGLKNEVRNFYRGLALNSLRKEGWFDFMVQPRTIEKIAEHFGYTDMEYLSRVLKVVTDDCVTTKDNGSYSTSGLVEEQTIVRPRFFGPAMEQICRDSGGFS